MELGNNYNIYVLFQVFKPNNKEIKINNKITY